jgi:cytochrome P450
MSKVAAIPPHIPAERVYDFDFFDGATLAGDPSGTHMALHERAPDVFFTPRNGGHWIATRAEDVRAIMTAPERFSSSLGGFPPKLAWLKLRLTPQDMDPPEHGGYRLLLMKFLGPKEVKRLEPQIRAQLGELIDRALAKGSVEFVADVAVPMPVKVFMSMMQWDLSRYAEFVRWANAILAGDSTWGRFTAFLRMRNFLNQQVRQRRERPGDDPISQLLASDIDGARVSEERVREICNLLFLAGLDTVTNALVFIVKHLAEHPEVQERLRRNPEQIPDAVEEFLRRYSFLNTPRRVTQDTEVGGVTLRKGEIVLASLSAASNDERQTADPARLDLDRAKPAHLAFNTGPHNCAGAALARLELKIFLETWLARVPPFRVAPGYTPEARGGPVMGLKTLPLVW